MVIYKVQNEGFDKKIVMTNSFLVELTDQLESFGVETLSDNVFQLLNDLTKILNSNEESER